MLYQIAMLQEKRETRFFKFHQAVGIAKHLHGMDRRNKFPRSLFIKKV